MAYRNLNPQILVKFISCIFIKVNINLNRYTDLQNLILTNFIWTYQKDKTSDDSSCDRPDGWSWIAEEEIVWRRLRSVAQKRPSARMPVFSPGHVVRTFGADDPEETSRHFAAELSRQLKKTKQFWLHLMFWNRDTVTVTIMAIT